MKTFKAVRLLIILENKILLIHNFLNPENPFYYFPGGHVEGGEDFIQAAKREIREELDLKDLEIQVGKLLYKQTLVRGENKKIEEFYLTKIALPESSDTELIEKTHGMNDPEHNGTDELLWISLEPSALPKKLFPLQIAQRLLKDYKNGFASIKDPVVFSGTE